jgi:hypothetical protein
MKFKFQTRRAAVFSCEVRNEQNAHAPVHSARILSYVQYSSTIKYIFYSLFLVTAEQKTEIRSKPAVLVVCHVETLRVAATSWEHARILARGPFTYSRDILFSRFTHHLICRSFACPCLLHLRTLLHIISLSLPLKIKSICHQRSTKEVKTESS